MNADGDAFTEAGGWPGVLGALMQRRDLDAATMRAVLNVVLSGGATDAQIAAFIVGLRLKGETAEEVTGLVDAMLDVAAPLVLDDPATTVDIVGTGGSRSLKGRAFNVSTMAAIVAASAGATVCKHGNRRASSASGGADLLEELRVELELNGEGVVACLRAAGIGFAFARVFHPSMRHVAAVRTELGVPTVFNVLGPLSHPGRARRQVIGVSDPALLELVSGVLARRDTIHAWVVHGEDGLDELTTTSSTRVIEVRDGTVSELEVTPESVGLTRVTLEDIAVGGPEENARAAQAVLAGERGPVRDMVVLNAGAALHVGGVTEDLRSGVAAAGEAIDSRAAVRTLEQLVAASRAARSPR